MDEDNQGRFILLALQPCMCQQTRVDVINNNDIRITIVLLRPITWKEGEVAAVFSVMMMLNRHRLLDLRGSAASRRSRTAGVYPGVCTLAQQVAHCQPGS